MTGAQAGTLTFMVGGADDDLKQAEPVLQKMGAKIFKCGSIGAGQIAKICNNLILGESVSYFFHIKVLTMIYFEKNSLKRSDSLEWQLRF